MENCNIKVDSYGSLIISTPELKNSKKSEPFPSSVVCPQAIPLNSYFQKTYPPKLVMRHYYLLYNCKRNEEGSQDLILNGNDLYYRIGRRLQNWDIPYLSLFVSKRKDVIRLKLANNDISSAGFMNLIKCTIACKHVLELDVRNNNITDSGINYMCQNGEKLQLQVLRLSGNKIGVENSQKIATMIATNNFIKHLDIAQIDQNESSLVYFTTVLRSDQEYFNESLKILDISRPNPQCLFTKFDSSHIATLVGLMLRHNYTLEELHLQKFNFFCHDIEEMLENASYNRTLRVLDLSCNNIGDHAMNFIGNWLEERRSLQSLLLAHNIITDRGISLLCRGIELSKLLAIDVSYNRLTDQSSIELVDSIKKAQSVQQLGIFGNNIGHPTAKAVQLLLSDGVLEQENLDAKPYEVDGIFYFAYYHREHS